MMVFWKQGYEGASLTDLTKAMGINRPSLYAAFGDKESLFRKVVDHYVARHSHHLKSATDEPTARRVIERLWANTINSVTSAGGPNGCLLVQGALACSADAKNAQKEVCKWRAAAETALRERFERAIEAGDLPKGTDAAAMARFAATVNHGIAVQASGGATKEELKRVAEIALQGIAGR